jgi:hypothetical protein
LTYEERHHRLNLGAGKTPNATQRPYAAENSRISSQHSKGVCTNTVDVRAAINASIAEILMVKYLHPLLGSLGWIGGLGVANANDNFFISHILLSTVDSPRRATEDIA